MCPRLSPSCPSLVRAAGHSAAQESEVIPQTVVDVRARIGNVGADEA